MIGEFLYKYYIDPIRFDQPYNAVETLTYAAILIVAVFLVYRWLKRSGLAVDAGFILATLPYVVLGGVLRVVQDTKMITSDLQFLLVTPLIYFVLFFYTVTALFLTRTCEKKGFTGNYLKYYAGIGIATTVAVAALLCWFGLTHTRIDPGVLAVILTMASVTTLAVWACMRYLLRWVYTRDPLYVTLIFGHMLDASATSYGIDLHQVGYVEQHVVGSNLIAWTGTAFSMFPLKLLVLFPAIYILEQFRKDAQPVLWHLIVLAMIVVGLAPGIRDTVRMVLYV
jgi:uncharacterized membrane protein